MSGEPIEGLNEGLNEGRGGDANAGRVGDWFQSYSGVRCFVLDMRPSEILIEDIAHHLALQCRFNGATRVPYSIAEHSVRVSYVTPPEHALWGLLHDAAEAYVGDMVRPLKNSMPEFRKAEAHVMAVICDRFGLAHNEPIEVKHADNTLLVTERRDLLTVHVPWSWHLEPLAEKIEPWSWLVAEGRFLARFKELGGA